MSRVSARIRPRSLVKPWSRRRNRFAFARLARRPKLFPSSTIVSKLPRDSSMSSIARDPGVADTAPPADLHGAGRDVDRDDVVATRLQVQRHAAGSRADVQDAAADQP